LTVECDGAGNTIALNAWLDTATATSDCGDVTLSNNLYNTISACGGGSEQVFVFQATDQCGNQTTGLASFTISDTADPTPVCPPTLVLECGNPGNDQAIAAWLLSVNITDATGCSGYSLSNCSAIYSYR